MPLSGDVLQEVKEGDISEELVKKFDEEKYALTLDVIFLLFTYLLFFLSLSLALSPFSFRRLEQQRRKERNEAHLYMTVEVYQDDDFQSHQRADLIDFDDIKGG